MRKKWYNEDLHNKKRELDIKARHMSKNPYNINTSNIKNNYFNILENSKSKKKTYIRKLKSEIVKQLNNLLTKM